MAYFAQAGSGQSHFHDGSRNEGAVDNSGQAAAGPRVTVQPHVTPRPGMAVPMQQAQSRSAPQSSVQSPSPFPVEGPDLYSNYQPRQPDPAGQPAQAEPSAAAPIVFAPAASQGLAPKLQDYVSEDYSVPGIGARNYGSQQTYEQNYAGQSSFASVDDEPGHAAQDETMSGTFGAAYGGATAQSYGYAQDETEDYGYDDSSYVTPVARTGFARTASLFGAVASLALVIGLGAWGYQLVMRDVSGVPVVRAVEGPMRAQPENPGGSQADHQGLSVNSVAANGSAEAPAERLTLAPQPIELSQDDQPMSRLIALEADQPPQVITRGEPQTTARLSDASVTAYQNGDIDALVAELTEGVAPLGAVTQQGNDQQVSPPAIVQPEPLQPVQIAAVGAATAPSSTLRNAPGIKVSLRPNLRPARFSSAAENTSAGTGRATLEADPNNLPAGTRLAQLGAYESAEVARAEWDRIYSRFDDYLEGKTRVIQRAESGGRTFYRLRAMGFDGLSDARRFCSALVAGKADCIPVTTR